MKNGRAMEISCKKVLTGPGDEQSKVKSERPGRNEDRG